MTVTSTSNLPHSPPSQAAVRSLPFLAHHNVPQTSLSHWLCLLVFSYESLFFFFPLSCLHSLSNSAMHTCASAPFCFPSLLCLNSVFVSSAWMPPCNSQGLLQPLPGLSSGSLSIGTLPSGPHPPISLMISLASEAMRIAESRKALEPDKFVGRSRLFP